MKQWLSGLFTARGRGRQAPRLGPSKPDGFDFDALARDLASGLSRREAIRRVGVAAATATLASLGLLTRAEADTVSCNAYCHGCTGQAHRQCIDTCVSCGGNPADVCGPCGAKFCTNVLTDVNNCGGCGAVCPSRPNSTAVCTGGQCGFTCTTGYADCDASTDNGCETNLTNDVGNCGGCGNQCPTPANTTPTCSAGVCGTVCNPGFADCNGNPTDGCEINLTSDVQNCGACGIQCPSGETCVNGHCTCGNLGSDCPGGQVCCSSAGGPICANLQGDTANCGACGQACPNTPHGTSVCSDGICGYVCTAPYADCNGSPADGCETDTSNNVNNCGGCGNVCSFANASAVCIGGDCQIASCNSGYGNCDNVTGNGCETHLLTDENNCGQCGNRCPTGATCVNGTCACPPGYITCNGACVDAQNDSSNCGGCGNRCPTGATCSSGTCVCPGGDIACSGVCINPMTDSGNCGTCGNACGADTCCSGACTDTTTNLQNCGGCGQVCSATAPNTTNPRCINGTCFVSCEAGYGDCDSSRDNGCETNLLADDDNNCGACGFSCPAQNQFILGVQSTNFHCCGGVCKDFFNDPNNCNGCGNTCPTLTTCIGGTCV